MKKIFFFTAITVLALSSCKKEVTAYLEDQSSNITGSSANNSVNTVPISYEATFVAQGSAWNSCTQEFIDFSGTGHVQARGMISDNKITYVFHVDYQNVKGVGRTSGTEYVATSTFNYTFSFNYNTQVVYQQSGTINWVAQGSGLSFTIVNDWHLTANANGEVTRFISTFGDVITCQ